MGTYRRECPGAADGRPTAFHAGSVGTAAREPARNRTTASTGDGSAVGVRQRLRLGEWAARRLYSARCGYPVVGGITKARPSTDFRARLACLAQLAAAR